MKMRVAVIGTGMAWDRLHYPAFAQLTDKFEIVAVCNKTVEKALNFAAQINLPKENVYSDYREMLKRNDIDVVDVLVPISENFEVTKDVLLSGRNLIAEKPFAATLEGAKELIRIKNEKNVQVMVAENFRYDECNQILKEILDNGQIGDIAYFIYNTGADFEKDMKQNTFSAKEWRQHPQYEGGSFLDGGIHDIALLRYLFGDVADLSAFARPHQREYCPYMHINCLLKFQNGVIGNYNYYASGAEQQKPQIGLRIFGTNGDVFMESKDCGHIYLNFSNSTCEIRQFTPAKGYYNELVNYYSGNILSTPELEIGDMELVFRILHAVK